MPVLLMTRPKGQNDDFIAMVERELGAPVESLCSPLMAISFMSPDPLPADYLILTSVHGVTAATHLGYRKGHPVWCVGQKTAKLAQEAGYQPHTGPGDAEGLIATILDQRPEGSFVHIRGEHARGDVAERLNAQGIPCKEVIAYQQQALPLSDAAYDMLHSEKPVVLPLFSPRTATILKGQGPFHAPLHVIAMSAAVAEAIDEAAATSMAIAASPDAKSAADEVVKRIKMLRCG